MDGLIELDLGNLQETGPSLSVLGNNVTQIFGRKLTATAKRGRAIESRSGLAERRYRLWPMNIMRNWNRFTKSR
jgi:hypothetical protein